MRRLALLVLLACLFPVGKGTAQTTAPVSVDFFYEQGCDECEGIRRDVLPGLEGRYSAALQVHGWDIGVASNYLKLVSVQDQFGAKDNEPVSMVVDGRDYLAGVARIKADLFPAVERALARHGARESAPAVTAGPGPLARRVEAFTLAGVVGAAVVDSINPCAISTLVFFMSLLSVARIGPRRMALAGLAFLAASFTTYLAIGFGLLRVLQWLAVIRGWRIAIEGGWVVVMMGFAFLSFRDAFRYHGSGRADAVSVKLPAPVQARIHRVMRAGLRNHSLVLCGLGVGAVVTVLESVCTGQVYVPALVMMVKGGQSLGRCALYLALYNAIFVLPLAVVLGLTCGGMGMPALVDWSRRNVTASKVALGLFFLGMSVLMVVMR